MTDQRPSPVRIPGKEALERPLPKRFYTGARAGILEEAPVVLLDGRPARTPGKRVLTLASPALAEAVAAEWAAQEDKIDPGTMPLTRLANTVVDGVAQQADAVRAEIVKYAGSDLVCYRADFPAELSQRQAAAWDPILDWAHRRMHARFYLTQGVMPVRQLPETLDRVAEYVAPLEPFALAATHVMMTLTGSALLALAVLDRAIVAETAWTAAHVDEDFQISQWGEDAEAMERRARRWQEMAAAARMVALTRG